MSENETPQKVSNEAIKFVAWAVGIGAGSTFMILSYASSTFLSKDIYAEKEKALNAKIATLESAVTKIETSNDKFQTWLRDNWHKRQPEN